MIDLHSHLLPGVDDGSRSLAQSVRVLRELAAQGVTDICLTPHLSASRAEAGVPANHDAAFDALRAEAPPEIRLHRGAEVMLDRPLGPGAAVNRGITLGSSRYLLVEFPRIVPAGTVATALRQVVACGLVPLLAHPERYNSCSVAAAQGWRTAGAIMQVDANTLLAPSARGERARQLVGAGLATVLAADNHGDDRSLAAVRDALVDQGGARQAEQLLVENPRAILDDGDVKPVEPFVLRRSLVHRLRRLLEGES
ncbi:MAG TPA: CpsB/CapC family capsule biosynthesis tyrosine phosphatase [Gemmatimonadales bacterium]|nr:CpsB/CapC family capsule biosynthesis tyrosine phosphatase [Gemmatimonadales bacterium]